jgi:hypothetical protein
MALLPRWRLSGLGWLFVALSSVFAFGGQLLMELHGGAGERDTSLDPRHTALLIAVIAIALLGCHWLRTLRAQADGDRDFHRLLKQSLSELPFRGRGAGFFLTIAMTTFGMGLLAHIGERSPSTVHDAIGWLVVALFVGVIAAIAARFIVRVLPDVVAAILAFFIAIDPRRSAPLVHGHVPVFTRRECWSPPLFNRPPPLLHR